MSGRFPRDFIWGAASSAFQTEGYALADGGGESIWDRFCHTPGNVAGGDTGDVACAAYYRFEEDLALLQQTGTSAYRFSTSWARIAPLANGVWNDAGLAYYDRVVDCCLEKGLVPYMTLYHWELPQAAEDRGGWLHPETAQAFGRFAGMMAAHFKGRVRHYFTLNEPQCTVKLGYTIGIHAPGKQLDLAGQFACMKNQMLAHGYAQRAIKAVDPEAVVGIASTGQLCYPHADSASDLAAAREACFTTGEDWIFTHHWLLDPICLGRFPSDGSPALMALTDTVTAEEMAIIHTVPDMLGYNIYNGHEISADGDGFREVQRYPGFPRTSLKWPVCPEVMNWGVRFLYERYPLPSYITENGQGCNDRLFPDEKVHDLDRIDFLAQYLACLHQAITGGADIRGYFHWALTDNLEWHSGYSDRFGLIFIDFPSGRRIPKDSYYWYRNLIQSGIPAFQLPQS